MKLNTLIATGLMALSLSATAAPAPSESAAPKLVIEDVSASDFNSTVNALKKEIAAEGWNLVAEINLGERLAKKGVQLPQGLIILEVTSGKNAVPLLKNDKTRYVSALMPCSVSVYGMSDGRIVVSRMNAAQMSGMLEPEVSEVMKRSALQFEQIIARALASR